MEFCTSSCQIYGVCSSVTTPRMRSQNKVQLNLQTLITCDPANAQCVFKEDKRNMLIWTGFELWFNDTKVPGNDLFKRGEINQTSLFWFIHVHCCSVFCHFENEAMNDVKKNVFLCWEGMKALQLIVHGWAFPWWWTLSFNGFTALPGLMGSNNYFSSVIADVFPPWHCVNTHEWSRPEILIKYIWLATPGCFLPS